MTRFYHNSEPNTKTSNEIEARPGVIGGGQGRTWFGFDVVRCLRRPSLDRGPSFLFRVDVSKARWRLWRFFGIVFLIPKNLHNTTLPVPGRASYQAKKKHFSILGQGWNGQGPGPCSIKMFLLLPAASDPKAIVSRGKADEPGRVPW